MMTGVPNTRRSLGKRPSKQGGSGVPNGHSHEKSNGCTTARRVRTVMTKCGCNEYRFFATAFAIATKQGNMPSESELVRQVDWFKALEAGDLSKLPQEGYEIPECVRFLANQVLGEILPNHHCPKQFFRGLQDLRRPVQSTISPAAL